MKVLRAVGWSALVLIGMWGTTRTGRGQNSNSMNHSGPIFGELPPHPTLPPDIRKKFESDPSVGIALREQARRNRRLRQKQLTEATELLLKVTLELRAEMAANPDAIPTDTETQCLKLIQKLARLIQESEMAEDQASATLAKEGIAP
ncbi:MAG: hypothetical protein ABSF23_00935 [Terracidiphilus sp.]